MKQRFELFEGYFWASNSDHWSQKVDSVTSLGVQWLRLCASNAGNVEFHSGWGTKILHAMWHSQKIFFKKVDSLFSLISFSWYCWIIAHLSESSNHRLITFLGWKGPKRSAFAISFQGQATLLSKYNQSKHGNNASFIHKQKRCYFPVCISQVLAWVIGPSPPNSSCFCSVMPKVPLTEGLDFYSTLKIYDRYKSL